MARFLSDAWFEELKAGSAAAQLSPEEDPLVLEHLVSGGPSGDVRYHVRALRGRAQVVPGPAMQPHVVFAEDYATAAAVASGELSAAAALLAGRIRVAGDMGKLISRQGDLAVDDPVPSAVRAATTF